MLPRVFLNTEDKAIKQTYRPHCPQRGGLIEVSRKMIEGKEIKLLKKQTKNPKGDDITSL